MKNVVLSTVCIDDLVSDIANEVVRKIDLWDISASKPDPIKKLVGVSGAAEILGNKPATIYSKVSRGEIPHMKRGGRLYFDPDELLEYLRGGRVRTNDELSEDAHTFLKNKKGLKL